jgi:hypothetical protein
MIFGRKPTITEELSAYATALLELSAKNAEELRLEYKFSNESTALVMTQIIGFSLINLRRQFAANGVDDSVFGKCALSITENMANIMIDDASNRPAFLSFFQDKIQILINAYSNLPLKNSDQSKGKSGTLLWEYGKLMSETITGEEKDLVSILECISVITNVQDAVKTDRLLRSVK